MGTSMTQFQGTENFTRATFNERISTANNNTAYVSNPNLLDNWYFARPVNQRGKTEYTANWQYGIDRWLCAGDGNAAVSDGHCTFTGAIDQGLSCEKADIRNRKLTMSILLKDNTLITGTAVDNNSATDISFVSNVSGVYLSLNSTDLSGYRRARMYFGSATSVIAAKLELGPTQTLAHQDAEGKWVLNEIPDYGEQLRRCQRYFVSLNLWRTGYASVGNGMIGSDGRNFVNVPLPVTMRTTPSIIFDGEISIDMSGGNFGTMFSATIANFGSSNLAIVGDVSNAQTNTSCYAWLAPSNDLQFSADL